MTSNYNGSQVSCNGSADGTITVTAGGGTGQLSYTLSGGTLTTPATNATGIFSGLGAGAYHYSVTDENNCNAAEGDVTIDQPAAITGSGAVTSNYNGSQVSCNGSADGTITVTAGGGTGQLSYTLSGGTLTTPATNATGIFSGLGAGAYHYSVTDENNCNAAEGDVTIDQPAAITGSGAVTSNYNGSQVSCNGSADGTITVTAGGGTGQLSYTLSGGTLTTPATNATGIFSGLGAGAYHYSVTDENNCNAAQGDVIITEPPLLTATITGTATVCENAASPKVTFANPTATPVIMTYTIDDGTSTTTTTINVPAGGTAQVNAPTTTIGIFTYQIISVQSQGIPACSNAITGQSAVITVSANSTMSLTSSVQTTSQGVCINFPITNITYQIGGGGTGAYISAGALPPGVVSSYSAGIFTISGSPASAGTFNYTVTTNGVCNNVSLSGSITAGAEPTITLSSPASTSNQAVCEGAPINTITYAIGGSATGAGVAGLPNGVTGSYNAGVFTISGSPTLSGTFNYVVLTSGGPCIGISASGTITVNANSTIVLSSSAQSAAQTICIGNAIASVTYAIDGGSTGATVIGLPPGVTSILRYHVSYRRYLNNIRHAR